MKATIDKDIIVVLGRGDVDIPDDFPRMVGLERLRWDGSKVVDLADLSGMWVEMLPGGAYQLHAVEVPRSYYVEMTYADRRKLSFNSHPKILTDEEILTNREAELISAAKDDLAKLFKKEIGTIEELIIVMLAALCGIIIFVRTGNETIGAKIDSALPDLQALPLNKMLSYSPGAFKKLKAILDVYFNRVGV